MPTSETNVGRIVDKSRQTYLEWEINDFTEFSRQKFDYLASPSFKFLDGTWRLKIYPNGDMFDSGWIALNLELYIGGSNSSFTVSFTLGIKHTNNERGPKTFTFDANNKSCGWTKICDKNFLFDLMKEFAPTGTLTVYCHIAGYASSDAACQTTSLYSTAMLSRDFQDLLLSERKSDVIIEVQDKEFKAHKCILEARSPVFAAMFDHDMSEKCDNVVRIPDCSPEAFQIFLHYMYTGKVEKVSIDTVTSLYTAADKYCVTDLKEKCAEFMAEELSVDTVCDIFVLSDRHSDEQLKKSAEEFLVRNMKTILPTSKWKSLMAKNSDMAAEIFMKVVTDGVVAI